MTGHLVAYKLPINSKIKTELNCFAKQIRRQPRSYHFDPLSRVIFAELGLQFSRARVN